MTHIFAAERRTRFGTWLPLLLVLAVCSPAGAADSWVGKTILVKKDDIRIGHTEGEESVYTATLRAISYRVLAEEGNFIKVREGRVEDWFSKNDAVLLEDAVDYFTDRIRANPEDASAYTNRAEAWSLKGELDIAIKDFDEAIRLNPKSAASFYNRGNAFSDKKDYDRAIRDYDEAIRLDPKCADAFGNRGNAYLGKKNYHQAIMEYDEVIRLDPKNANAFFCRGIAYERQKEYDRAIKNYEEAIRLDPKDADAFNNRGCVYRYKKDYDRAIKDYQEAIRLDPKYAYPYGNRAIARSKMKQYAEAVLDFEEALRLAPSMDWLHHSYAFFRATCPESDYRDGKKAVELAKKAIELADSDADWEYHATLAAAYAEAGQFDKAVEEQTKALEDKSLDREDRDKMEQRLKLYREKKPYRDVE
jgi:tetratricopeptide (TPR) repeat protein